MKAYAFTYVYMSTVKQYYLKLAKFTVFTLKLAYFRRSCHLSENLTNRTAFCR